MSLVVPDLFDLHSHLADFEQNTRYQDLATLCQETWTRVLLGSWIQPIKSSRHMQQLPALSTLLSVKPLLMWLMTISRNCWNRQRSMWSNPLCHTHNKRISLKMMQKRRILRIQKQHHPHQSSQSLGFFQNAAQQGLDRGPPQPASGSRSESIRKSFHNPSPRTQEQTFGWQRVTLFITG